MKIFSCISIALAFWGLSASMVSYADSNYPEQSSDVQPPALSQTLGNSYVLGTGTYTLYCSPGSGWNTNCDYTVTTTQCPIGYTAQATVSPVWNAYRADDEMRGYFLSPTADSPKGPAPTGPLIPTDNGTGGYNLHFSIAYANFVLAEDEYITINYSVVCLPTNSE